MKSVRIFLSLLTAIILGGALLTSSASARPSREALQQAIKATVLVLTLDDEMNVIATGSGSIVDARGLILTNFHVVGDPDSGQLYSQDGLVGIALTKNLRQPAVPLFIAQVVRGSAELDLAAVQVVADVEGNNLKGCLELPTYSIGNSEDLLPGDSLTAIGFPGLGGYSYTVTEGQVSGFEAAENGVTVWVKTDAEISPGNSGGSAVNDAGDLIGVPSAGRVDQEAGGKIGLVRPINLASLVLTDLEELDYGRCQGSPPTFVDSGAATVGGTGGTGGTGTEDDEAAEEVVLVGRVVSADSGRPIRNAYFIVLKPGVTWEEITDRNLERNALDVVQTDRSGNFQTSIAFDTSQTYSIGVVADGYGGLFGDDLTLTELSEDYDGGNVVDLGVLELKR